MELVVDGGLTVRAAEKLCRDQAFERDASTAAADAEAAGLTAPVHVDDTLPAPTDGDEDAGPEAIAGAIAPAEDSPMPAEEPATNEQFAEPTAAAAEPDLKVFDAEPASTAGDGDAPKSDAKTLTPHLESVRDGLRDQLGIPVEIVLRGAESGQIRLNFADNAAFEGLLKRLRAA